MNWVLGVDGGGSKTLMALASPEGQVQGPFRAEGVNPFDNASWKQHLTGLLQQLPCSGSEIAYAALGLPGYGEVPRVSAEQVETVGTALTQTAFAVLNDVEVAFVGAHPGQAGVLILSGTGSMAWAASAHRQLRVGGWGDGFGDEGSAYWIGQRALGSLSKALDGRLEDPGFASGMLEVIGARDGEGLLEWFYRLEHPRSGIARLAQSVDHLAGQGNPTARALLKLAADELVLLAQAAFRQLGDPTAHHFSYAGSVFNSALIKAWVGEALQPLGTWAPPALPPIGGALLYAARKAGWPVDPGWIARLKQELQD
ncbi:MAG: hypothetical protein K6T57_12455 [Thermaceae bacterium]|nr:hypothetical protein [Thermaceae bacterium]